MSKYFKLAAYILIGMVAFTLSSEFIINTNTSQFQDDVVVPNTSYQLSSTSTRYFKFADKFTIQTTDRDSPDEIEQNFYWNGNLDYIKLSAFSKTDEVNIYGGNSLDSIADSKPLVTCPPDEACGYETDVEYNYYQIQSAGKVDLQVITGKAEQNQDN